MLQRLIYYKTEGYFGFVLIKVIRRLCRSYWKHFHCFTRGSSELKTIVNVLEWPSQSPLCSSHLHMLTLHTFDFSSWFLLFVKACEDELQWWTDISSLLLFTSYFLFTCVHYIPLRQRYLNGIWMVYIWYKTVSILKQQAFIFYLLKSAFSSDWWIYFSVPIYLRVFFLSLSEDIHSYPSQHKKK